MPFSFGWKIFPAPRNCPLSPAPIRTGSQGHVYKHYGFYKPNDSEGNWVSSYMRNLKRERDWTTVCLQLKFIAKSTPILFIWYKYNEFIMTHRHAIQLSIAGRCALRTSLLLKPSIWEILFFTFLIDCFRNDYILIDTDRMILTPVFHHYHICSIFMKLLHYILFLCCYDS